MCSIISINNTLVKGNNNSVCKNNQIGMINIKLLVVIGNIPFCETDFLSEGYLMTLTSRFALEAKKGCWIYFYWMEYSIERDTFQLSRRQM